MSDNHRKAKGGMQRKKKKGINEDDLNETNYVIQEKYRKVEPYVYVFNVFSKARWIGSTLLDVFVNEFSQHTPAYYKRAIPGGMIKINDVSVTVDTVIKEHDLISHMVHRHEPNVLNLPIDIVYEDDEILVVNKPCSIPVHPSGRFRHNTLLFILAKDYGYTDLYLVHRIDKLTSGIVILGKNPSIAAKLAKLIKDGEGTKNYLALVQGQFSSDIVDVDIPILTICKALGMNETNPDGKESRTLFKILHYDSTTDTSVLQCRPLTGRTHQIRLHLKYLNNPIIGDDIYNEESELETLEKYAELNEQRTFKLENEERDASMEYPDCPDCLVPYPDLKDSDLVMNLHALSYRFENYSFVTSMPEWASMIELTQLDALDEYINQNIKQ